MYFLVPCGRVSASDSGFFAWTDRRVTNWFCIVLYCKLANSQIFEACTRAGLSYCILLKLTNFVSNSFPRCIS